MQSFFFGPAPRQLHGVWYPPQGQRRAVGVLVLPSYGQEVSRGFRLLRVLADRLALQGADVLRFDWRGSADSAGDDEDACLSAWCEDAQMAHAELLARARPQRVIWLGVRLGATVALQAAAGLSRELVLLEPVLDGAALLAQWQQAHGDLLERAYPVTNTARRQVLRKLTEPQMSEALGFGLSPTFITELRAVQPVSLPPLPAGTRAALLAHGELPGLPAWLDAQPAGAVQRHDLPLSLPWTKPEAGTAPVPAPVLRALLEACAL